MFQSFHVANCSLVEQVLKCAAVLKATIHLRHEFVRNVYGKAAAIDPAVKNMALVLLTTKASFAVLSDAPSAAKTQRSKSSWPKAGSLFLKPFRNICGKFFLRWHAVYVTTDHMYSQAKSCNRSLCSNL